MQQVHLNLFYKTVRYNTVLDIHVTWIKVEPQMAIYSNGYLSLIFLYYLCILLSI